MGCIAPEMADEPPGYLSPAMGVKFTTSLMGLTAASSVPACGYVQTFEYAGYCELAGPATFAYTEDYAESTPGDNDFQVLMDGDPAGLTTPLNAAIAKGGMALMTLLRRASPLRALVSERGLQDPVCCWHLQGSTAAGALL